VRGRWPDLAVAGEAHGRDLSAGAVRLRSLAFSADLAHVLNPEGVVQADLAGLVAAGLEFSGVHARASGGPAAHRLTVRARGSPLTLDLDLEGVRSNGRWSGSLQRLVFDVENAARLTLREPVRLAANENAFEMSRACLADRGIEVCASAAAQRDGALHASYSIVNVPLRLANVFASAKLPLQFDGLLQGEGDVRRTPGGELFGSAEIHSPSGSLSRVSEAQGPETAQHQTLLSWRDLRIAANLAGVDARATLNATIQNNGSVRGEASVRGLGQDETPISGRLLASLPDLAPLAVFAPQVDHVQGRADADFSVAGALQSPQITGELSASNLAADVPAMGLRLKNGRLAARPATSGEIALSGSLESGDGRLAFAGRMTADGALEVNVNGDRVLAADIPGARVVATPDLKFVRAGEELRLSGAVTIPEAVVNLQKLPRGADRAQAASEDVVIIDAKTREEQAAAAPLYADVKVIIGDKVTMIGFGLQAQVQGRIDVHEAPGEPTVGSGEVRVTGRYKAYGQDLTLKEGRLLYARTPLDDPRLNFEATRQVEDVTVGLRVRGAAKHPELTVFSDPPMAQMNALSYLVAGKPLEDIGAGEGEGDALQAATRSLGAAVGGLLAKNVGRRLGLSDVTVKEEEMIGGAALTVGRYLSPRLYLSYGVGLFEPGDVVTLRYRLSEGLNVSTQYGPEDTRTGIEYRVEK
ncbi:MAG TPA: translocation/assembly module TamB domain-containing protein, partial [Steroidobacter sp.]|nr:translocation/assembly module TamB domain-containing protein [Steroidobacter sp.]